MIAKTKIICAACGKEVEKTATEIKRQKKKGKKLFYCNLSCAGKVNTAHLKPYQDKIKEYSAKGNWAKKTDEYSQFRYHLRNAKRHARQEIQITLQDLLELWNTQNGLCAVTKIPLLSKYFDDNKPKNPYQASLDRIDHTKGYTKQNVRFVCYMFNIARNNFSDKDVLEFCKKVMCNV